MERQPMSGGQIIILFMLIILLVSIPFTIYRDNANKDACEKAGGVYHEQACMDSKYFVDY